MPTTLLIFITTLCTIGSQLVLKRAVGNISAVLREAGIVSFLIAAATSPAIILALSIQAAGYVVWLFVLTQEKLSVAFAISGSFFYLTMAAASWLFFAERLNAHQWVGLVMITMGVLLINLGGQH